MKIFLFINVIYICFSLDTVLNGVYNLIHKNLLVTCIDKKIQLDKSQIGSIKSSFRMKKYSHNQKNSFYYIESIETNNTIIVYKNKEIISYIKQKNDLSTLNIWSFIITKNQNYIIQNKNKCYLKVTDLNINCENISIEKASQFRLIKLYEEVNENKYDNELIEKEPIDVLIKYIDLKDPLLKRNGIHQIKKDLDNEELRFSIRSILKNIPWVRKIFILMPNEKVKYFKNYNLIKKKIVYVKDKDLLGFESSSSIVFQFNYWKMKKFGISNNFIIMDDDCFIGSPLKKTDFFYNNNNKIIPLIINNRFKYISQRKIEKKLPILKKKIKKSKREQTRVFFDYSKYLTYLFIIKIFKKPLIIPKFTHNAIPVNLNEIKEIYDLVLKSQYKSDTLYSTYRKIESLQFQTFVLSYTFMKYNKKVKYISYKYISNKNSLLANYNYQLFCINTNGYDNSNLSFLKTKLVMEYLFPDSTPYEIINYSSLFSSFKLVNSLKKDNSNQSFDIFFKNITLNIEKRINLYKTKKNNFIFNIVYIIILLLFKKYLKYYSFFY